MFGSRHPRNFLSKQGSTFQWTNVCQTCPCCGHVSKDNRRTQAKFECVECRYENHADLVGAINILRAGHAQLACGETAQSGCSMKQEPAEATPMIPA